jgi:hypothetical protein
MALTLLGGCAGSALHDRMLEQGGDVTVMPASAPSHDFIVSVKNTVDFGHNPEDRATREAIALRIGKAQCASASIVGETSIVRGEALIGRPHRTFFIQVKC